jgi:hypothetical protein
MILAQNLETPYRRWTFLISVLSASFARGARPACPDPLGDAIGVLNSFSVPAASALWGSRRACPPSFERAFRFSLCFPVSPLEATLTKPSASVHSKRLTQRLNPLECALTKNGEGRGIIVNQKHSIIVHEKMRAAHSWAYARIRALEHEKRVAIQRLQPRENHQPD